MPANVARYIVDAYYQAQNHRIRAHQQIVSEHRDSAIVTRIMTDAQRSERTYRTALGRYAAAHTGRPMELDAEGNRPGDRGWPVGSHQHLAMPERRATMEVHRTGPLASHGQQGRKETLQHQTQDPLLEDRGVIRKSLGAARVPTTARVYLVRKEREVAKNAMYEFKDQAAEILRNKNIGKETDAFKAYSEGKLPPAHIHARAKRYAVKLFLSHWHYVAFESRYGVPPERPYILTKPEHSEHFIHASGLAFGLVSSQRLAPAGSGRPVFP